MSELNITELRERLDEAVSNGTGLNAYWTPQASAALQSAEARAREAEGRVTVLAGAAKAVHAECLEARASADDLLIRDATLNRLAAAIQALGASHG